MDKIVYTTKPSPDSLPGFFESKIVPNIKNIKMVQIDGLMIDEAYILEKFLTQKECQELIDMMNTSDNFEEVGVQGMKDMKDERIGSLRTSIWSPETSEIIWERLEDWSINVTGDLDKATDWWQHLTYIKHSDFPLYKPVALSPLLRFMKYENSGQHYAHYDASYIYPDTNYRSLKSVVIYLTTNEGAATRFINDGQQDIPIMDRIHDDWNRPVKSEEIIGKSECIQGNVLIFDHRLCHDVEQYLGDKTRIIIRTDLIYKLD